MNFDPPEPPIQFANEEEICIHNNYGEECLECAEEATDTEADIKRKEFG